MKRTLFAVMALLASGAALADECSSRPPTPKPK